jgi:hypothetical protein
VIKIDDMAFLDSKKRFLGSEIGKSHCLFLFLKIDKKWFFKKQPFFEKIFLTNFGRG